MYLQNMLAAEFYESQLAILALFCIASVFFERQAAKQKRQDDRANGVDGEVTTSDGTANGGWRGDKGGSRPASALARQYLVVYAIVMGALRFVRSQCFGWLVSLTSVFDRSRRGLASRPICIQLIPRAICFLGASSCHSFRDWIPVSGNNSANCWRMGRSAVCVSGGLYCSTSDIFTVVESGFAKLSAYLTLLHVRAHCSAHCQYCSWDAFLEDSPHPFFTLRSSHGLSRPQMPFNCPKGTCLKFSAKRHS
jgi:hypothetical protein